MGEAVGEFLGEAVSESEFDGAHVVGVGVVDVVVGVGLSEDVVDALDEHGGGDLEGCSGVVGGSNGGGDDAVGCVCIGVFDE